MPICFGVPVVRVLPDFAAICRPNWFIFFVFQSSRKNSGSAYRGSNPWGAAKHSDDNPYCTKVAASPSHGTFQSNEPNFSQMRTQCGHRLGPQNGRTGHVSRKYWRKLRRLSANLYREERPVDYLSDSAPSPSVLEGYITETDLARQLKRSVRTLQRLAARQSGPPRIKHRPPNLLRIESVRAWLVQQERKPAASFRSSSRHLRRAS
jgi:hypothetical protein